VIAVMTVALHIDLSIDADGTRFFCATSPRFDEALGEHGGLLAGDRAFVFYTRKKATIVPMAIATMLEIVAGRVRRLDWDAGRALLTMVFDGTVATDWTDAARGAPDSLV
jgi:hypothetical protein